GGFGMARALGWKFRDRDGREIEEWTGLRYLAEIQAPKAQRLFDKLTIAVDVQNPLLGPRGATRVYGPQKGLKKDDFALAERSRRKLARVMRDSTGRDVAKERGAGAAGGLGFGLSAFLGGALEPGFEIFTRLAGLERRLRWADVVITGEGRIDAS